MVATVRVRRLVRSINTPAPSAGCTATSLVMRVVVHRAVIDRHFAGVARATPACASSSSCRRDRGSPRGHGRRGSRCGWPPSSSSPPPGTIRLSNSSVSIRSEFQISERSVTRDVADAAMHLVDQLLTPSVSTSPVRNTAQLFCITCCIAVAQLRGRRAAGGVAELVEAAERAGRRQPAGSSGCLPLAVELLGAAQRRGAAEHDEVDQRVGAEAVGAVHRDAGGFADRHQARHDDVVVAVLAWSALRRDSWSGCRPCCSARSAASGSARA